MHSYFCIFFERNFILLVVPDKCHESMQQNGVWCGCDAHKSDSVVSLIVDYWWHNQEILTRNIHFVSLLL